MCQEFSREKKQIETGHHPEGWSWGSGGTSCCTRGPCCLQTSLALKSPGRPRAAREKALDAIVGSGAGIQCTNKSQTQICRLMLPHMVLKDDDSKVSVRTDWTKHALPRPEKIWGTSLDGQPNDVTWRSLKIHFFVIGIDVVCVVLCSHILAFWSCLCYAPVTCFNLSAVCVTFCLCHPVPLALKTPQRSRKMLKVLRTSENCWKVAFRFQHENVWEMRVISIIGSMQASHESLLSTDMDDMEGASPW